MFNHTDALMKCFGDFLEDLKRSYPDKQKIVDDFGKSYLNFEQDTTNKLPVLRELHGNLKIRSKQILMRMPEIFNKSFYIHAELPIDMKEIWATTAKENQEAIWQYVENLYVLSHLALNPKSQAQFLRVIQDLKRQGEAERALEQMNAGEPTSEPARNSASAQSAPPNMNDAVQSISEMFGLNPEDPSSSALGEMIQDVAGHMGKLMENNANPADLLTSMMSGDMSMFGGIVEQVQSKFNQKIESGELNPAEIMKQTQRMMSQMGMDQMGMDQMGTDQMGMDQMGASDGQNSFVGGANPLAALLGGQAPGANPLAALFGGQAQAQVQQAQVRQAQVQQAQQAQVQQAQVRQAQSAQQVQQVQSAQRKSKKKNKNLKKKSKSKR